MQKPIYLDYAASTPVDPRVAQAMGNCLTMDGIFGNPASRSHLYGWQAEEAVENARNHVATLIGADPREVVWTSGATEANNLALKGLVEASIASGRCASYAACHVITSAVEHKAVLDTCSALANRGVNITYLQPDRCGCISLDKVVEAMKDNTLVVSLMHVNNEVGAKLDVASVGAECRRRGIIFHSDGAQSVGKEAVDVKTMNLDMLSISAHKFYGPKGIGALYVRRTTDFAVAPQIHGGGHERKMRSGTLPTHQIVGLGEAAKIALSEREVEQKKLHTLRHRFWQGVRQIQGVGLNSDLDAGASGILNVQFAGVDGEALLMGLRDLAISSGSACTSASVEPSYVLTAMGLSPDLAQSSLRFSFGRYTEALDIDRAVEKVCTVVSTMRKVGIGAI